MNTYTIKAEETQTLVYEIEATSKEEAMDKWRGDGSFLYTEDHSLVFDSIELNDGEEANEEDV